MKIVIKSNFSEKLKELEKGAKSARKLLPTQVFRALTLLEISMKQNIRTRSGLNVRSGSLLNSIQKQMSVSGDKIKGTVGPEGVPYAAVHEYGHTFPSRFVAPRNKLALKWEQGGKTFFSKGHKIPSFKVPARPYIGPAIEEVAPKIEEELSLFIEEELEKPR